MQCRPFAHPSKVVHLWRALYGIVAEKQAQFLKVHYSAQLSTLAPCLRETRGRNLIECIQIQHSTTR